MFVLRLGEQEKSNKVCSSSYMTPMYFTGYMLSSMASLVVSLSNGKVALLRPDPVNGLSVEETWHAHDHEPWVAAWEYWDNNLIYSGEYFLVTWLRCTDLEQEGTTSN